MKAEEYWLRLQSRIVREIHGLAGDEWRGWWCDGLAPDEPCFKPGPTITGTIWLGRDGQGRWRFEIDARSLPHGAEPTDWSILMPADDMTGWLSLDLKQGLVKINPAAAYPDRNIER